MWTPLTLGPCGPQALGLGLGAAAAAQFKDTRTRDAIIITIYERGPAISFGIAMTIALADDATVNGEELVGMLVAAGSGPPKELLGYIMLGSMRFKRYGRFLPERKKKGGEDGAAQAGSENPLARATPREPRTGERRANELSESDLLRLLGAVLVAVLVPLLLFLAWSP